MKRYKRFIDTHYDWSDESCSEKAFEQAYIVDKESPDGKWVKWEDVEQEMMPIPVIEIVETEVFDPRERFVVAVNGIYDGASADIERARRHVERLKWVLNIKDNDNDNH